MTDKDKFIAQLDDKITEISNQDAVRAETMRRELDDGTMSLTVSNTVNVAQLAYTEALNSGFSDDQAFLICCKASGLDN